jgi:hypothetical protein
MLWCVPNWISKEIYTPNRKNNTNKTNNLTHKKYESSRRYKANYNKGVTGWVYWNKNCSLNRINYGQSLPFLIKLDNVYTLLINLKRRKKVRMRNQLVLSVQTSYIKLWVKKLWVPILPQLDIRLH